MDVILIDPEQHSNLVTTLHKERLLNDDVHSPFEHWRITHAENRHQSVV